MVVPNSDVGHLVNEAIIPIEIIPPQELEGLAQGEGYTLYESKGGWISPKRRYFTRKKTDGTTDVIFNIKNDVAHLPNVQNKDVKKVVRGFEEQGYGGAIYMLKTLGCFLTLSTALVLTNDAESSKNIYGIMGVVSFISLPTTALLFAVDEGIKLSFKQILESYKNNVTKGKEALEKAFGYAPNQV